MNASRPILHVQKKACEINAKIDQNLITIRLANWVHHHILQQILTSNLTPTRHA